MNQYKYLLSGDPHLLSRIKTGKSVAWNETKTIRWRFDEELSTQNTQMEITVKPLYLEVHFYLPLPKQKHKNRGDGCAHAERPAVQELLFGLLSLMHNRVFAAECQVAHMIIKKYYSDIPRTECIFTEVIL